LSAEADGARELFQENCAVCRGGYIDPELNRDGRYVAAGSFSLNTAVVLDAGTLEPGKHMDLESTGPDGNIVESDCGAIRGIMKLAGTHPAARQRHLRPPLK